MGSVAPKKVGSSNPDLDINDRVSQLGRESHHFTTYLTDSRDDNLHVLFFTLSQKSLSIKKIEPSLGFIFKFKFVVAFRKGVNCQPGAFITFLHLICIRRRS